MNKKVTGWVIAGALAVTGMIYMNGRIDGNSRVDCNDTKQVQSVIMMDVLGLSDNFMKMSPDNYIYTLGLMDGIVKKAYVCKGQKK